MSTIEADLDPEMGRETRRQITPSQKLAQEVQQFLAQCLRIGGMSFVLLIILLSAFLTLDIPVRAIDRVFAPVFQVKPSVWLTWGHLLLAMVPLFGVLFARRCGGEEVSRAVLVAWVILTIFVVIEISLLAPIIENGDFPSARFTIALASSAMLGQLVAIAFYDVARGGGFWWRAPLYAALSGFFITGLIYFPVAYWNSTAPWVQWMVGDFIIKVGLAIAFVPVYGVVKKQWRPLRGYGG